MGEKIKSLTKKQKIWLFTIGIVVIAVIVAISVSIIADNNKINLADTYIVKVEGIDTQGTASCQINKKSLETILAQRNIDASKTNTLLTSMKCSLNKTDNLKNGDKITAIITFNDTVARQLNLSFKNTEKVIEVSGLPKGKEIDVFKDLKVTYTGISPEGKVSAVSISRDPFISKINFVSSKDKVSNGDKIMVEAKYTTQEAIAYKALVKETKKTYSVSGLPEYLSKANQLGSRNLSDIKSMSDELIGETLKISTPYFINHIPDLHADPTFTLGDNYSYTNIQLKRAYMYTMKENNNLIILPFKYNAIYTVSSVDIIANGKVVGTTFMTAEIDDAILNKGKLSGTGKNANQFNTEEDIQKSEDERFASSQFNVEPIKIQ